MTRVYRRTSDGGVRRPCRAAIAIVAGLVGLTGCREAAREVRCYGASRLMGAPWTITVHAETRQRGDAAIAAAFAEVARLERILSDYDPESELSRLSAASPTVKCVSDDLWRVLERAVWFRDATEAAFDPTIGPLTTLWRQARRSGRMPSTEKLSAARAAVGPSTLRLDPAVRSVELLVPDMRLDLGGIGMGYAADAAMAILERHGVRSAMIDASGDIVVSSPPPGRRGWRIVVDALTSVGRPTDAAQIASETLELADAAVTTSGDAHQAVEIDGVRYSHIVDPRSGLGVVGRAAVTVIARDGTTADAVATAASVLGPVGGLRFVESLPGVEGRFQQVQEGDVVVVTTAGWPAVRH